MRTCERSSESFEFRFGVGVEGVDGPVGTLSGLLLDPHIRQVVGLGIRSGLLGSHRLWVPLEVVTSATEGEVRLDRTMEEVREYRQPPEKPFRMCTSPLHPGSTDWTTAMFPAPSLHLPDAVRVVALDGTAGRVRRVLVDAASRVIREVIVESGFFSRESRRLPGTWVRRISGTALEVEATLAALAFLPLFRGDQEIRAAILDAWFHDDVLRPMFLRAPLDVQVRQGVAMLEGHAWSGSGRRRLEARARAVPGVLEVRSAIVSDDDLPHAVASSLADDPLGQELRPRIRSSLGVISLEGQTPDTATRANSQRM